MENYNIHKLCYKNNLDSIKKLLDKNIKLLYERGINEEYPIHIACFIGSEKLIDLILEYDKDQLFLENIKGQTGYHILTLYPKILINKLKLIKNNQFDINKTDKSGNTILISYLIHEDKINEDILIKLKKLGAKLNEPVNSSKLTNILIKNCDLSNKIHEIFSSDLNDYNVLGVTPLHVMIQRNDINCVKNLLKKDVNIKDSGITGKHNLFEHALRYGKDEIIELLLNYNLDFNYANQYNDTYLHFVLMSPKGAYKKELINSIFKKTEDVNIQNIDGDTAIHILAKKKEINNYLHFLNNKKVDISLTNKEGKKVTDYLNKSEKEIFLKNIKFLKAKDCDNKICKKEVKLLKVKKSDFTLFTSYPRDAFLYNIVMLEKYSNLKMPFCNIKSRKISDLIFKSKKINTDLFKKFWSGIKLLYENFNGLLCTEMYWNSKELYFQHDNFYESITKLLDNDIIYFNLTLVNIEINHANIVIIDNILETIERFDPYGLMGFNAPDDLDNLLDREINNIILKKKNKTYKYLAPKDFMKVNSFQSISRHDSIENKNIGDIGGFCLAWSFWYLENRLNNMGISQDTLVRKLEKKLINNKMTIIEYIRSYANKLHLEKAKLLKEFKISPSEYYKIYPGMENTLNLYELIYNKIKIL